MKYIMLKRADQLVPIIFPDFLNHIDIAKALVERGPLALSSARIVSAGSIGLFALSTDGHSETLGITSQVGDRQTINVYDYSHGQDLPNNTQTEHLVALTTCQALLKQLEAIVE